MKYVICPETIVGPAPSEEFLRAFPALRPNHPCGLRVPVVHEAPAMDFRCARGHRFIASSKEVHHEGRG